MVLLPVSGTAQRVDSAHALLYFPQFADGGPIPARWQTSFTFANPNSTSATVFLNLYNDSGAGLPIDFGGGPSNQFSFTIPASGSVTFRSIAASTSTVVGWATASASVNIQGVATYRFLKNGDEAYEVSVPGTEPTVSYFSAANAPLGIAVANQYSSPLTVQVAAHANTGADYTGSIVLPGLGHRSASLSDLIPSIPQNFLGTVSLYTIQPTSTAGPAFFLALTLKTDTGAVYSSLPSGATPLPGYQYEKVWTVFQRIREASRSFGTLAIPSVDNVQLTIKTDPVVNAFAASSGITIYYGLAELIADSDSELAFIVGHEMGHVYQFRTGKYLFNRTDGEFDADTWGMLLELAAGYDPYAGAGTLAKLAMATGSADLLTQVFEQLNAYDAHKSFNTRLDLIEYTIQTMCTLSEAMASLCNQYHLVFHPHLPGPLIRQDPRPKP
jgi:hypothetical protein